MDCSAIGDGIAALMAAGVVDNKHKEIDTGVTVGTMLMGTRRLYRFADHNPAIRLRATSYTADRRRYRNDENRLPISQAIGVYPKRIGDRGRLLRGEMSTKSSVMLTPKQMRFVEEYLVDFNGKQAAIRAGYASRSAEVQASRMLRNAKVQKALETAMHARSKRTEITADRVVTEFAKIALANMRDYWPRPGETIDLHRLDQDRTAAVAEIVIDESVDPSGVLHRRIHLKLHDKQRALDSLARHLGIYIDRHVAEGSIEHRVMSMTREERVACAEQLIEKGQTYLPLYEEWERKRSQEG